MRVSVISPGFIKTPMTDKNKFKSDNSIQFMIESLDDLRENIKKNGGELNCYYGENDTIVKKLIKNAKNY